MEGSKRSKAKKDLTKLRIEEQEIKSQAGKLGDITTTITPEDIIMMFAGKTAVMLTKQKVAMTNISKGLMRAYKEIHPATESLLEEYTDQFVNDFEKTKRKITRIASQHALSQRLCQIRGFTSYRLALFMALIKDIARFDTPGALMVKAKNDDRCELWDKAKAKAEDVEPGWYMKDRKKQSLKMWAHSNARIRSVRVLMHLLYTEWRELKELPVRVPYPIEYLGHQHLITLEEVLNYEAGKFAKD